MPKNQRYQRDCTVYCKSVIHGDLITAAITKRSVSDLELCSYLNFICTNCESVRDSSGRTALHVAASCGRIDLVRWLLNIKNANINSKDEESGYTALHRALFYGCINIAVDLIKQGANCISLDVENLTPLEHVTKDGEIPKRFSGTLYTWGLNNNNSLGSFSTRSSPECLDIFHKSHPKEWVQQVCIDKFHSLIVTLNGDVYSCGHGLGGRLGLGTEQTVVVPTKIDFQSSEKVFIVKASIARDHCLFLTSERLVYSCGSNKYQVLGVSAKEGNLLVPRKIKSLLDKHIIGISAARYHSAAWTSTTLYIWGLNVGQFGHETVDGKYSVNFPKPLRILNTGESFIKKVASSDGAIAVLTCKGDIYILHEYQCRKIGSRLLDVEDVALIGGKLNNSLDKELKMEPNKELKVVITTSCGHLLLWQETDAQLCRCFFSVPRAIVVKQVAINLNEIIFINEFGEAFKSALEPTKTQNQSEKSRTLNKVWMKQLCVSSKGKRVPNRRFAASTLVETHECITLKTEKIPKIYRALSIVSDPRGEDYCVIQQCPYNDNHSQGNIPKSVMKNQLRDFLCEASEDDKIHDVLLKIGNRVFPAHKYILSYRSRVLRDLCQDKEEINLNIVDIEIFEQMLMFIYTLDCELLQVGECPDRFKKFVGDRGEVDKSEINDFTMEKKKNPIRMLQDMARKYGCSELFQILNNYDMQDCYIHKSNVSMKVLPFYQKDSFPEYHDFDFKCSDNVVISAHKCILAARMEYFSNMFSLRWDGGKENISVSYPGSLVEAFIEYIYTDSRIFLVGKDCDFLLKLLIMADEYMLTDLKDHCAFAILNNGYIDLKNAVEILQIAHYYKSSRLKGGVMNYISNNMAFFLESRSLDDLTDDVLKDLSHSYFEQRLNGYSRVITPYSTAVSDEEIAEIANISPVNISCPEKKKPEKNTSNYSNKRRTKSIRNDDIAGNSETKCVDDKIENLDAIVQFPDIIEASIVHTSSNQTVQKRLAAISLAVDQVSSENCVPAFQNLKASFLSTNSDDFPLLSSPPKNNWSKISSPPNYGKIFNKNETKQKMVKISQRERKRLSSESKDVTTVTQGSPKNPWKIIVNDAPTSVGSPPDNTSFYNIQSSEKKQKENLIKITNKLLLHTQMEDKAILDLEKFYSIDNIEDEIITVHRVDIGSVAVPVWVPRNPPHSSYS